MTRIVLLGPPLDGAEATALESRLSRLRDDGFEVEIVLAPADPSQSAKWQTTAKRVAADAKWILAIEPSLADPDGRYRRELSVVFARLDPKARARCIPCKLGLPSHGDDVGALAGPRGRAVLDLAQDASIPHLKRLLEADAPEVRPPSRSKTNPVVLSDHAAEVDGIGFERAVDAFVDLLEAQSTKPPIVASVEGGWGVGKSSFLNFARKKIRERGWQKLVKPPADATERDPPSIRTVWFSAWSNDGELSTFAAFALALVRELTNVSVLHRPGLRLRLAFARFDWASGWRDVARLGGALMLLILAIVVGVAGWTDEVGKWLETRIGWVEASVTAVTALLGFVGVQRLWAFFGSPLAGNLTQHFASPDYEKHLAPRELLYTDIERIIDVYTRGAGRLYVFVDDLDRADPARVAELTQTIGVLLARAGSRSIYVLAMDREKVAAAIAARHKEIAGIVAAAAPRVAQPLDFGQAFLEKLVQLPFRVPSPGATDLSRWIGSVAPNTEGLEEAVRMVAPFLGSNPRRVKQFVNLVHLRLRIVVSHGVEHVLSFHQLAKLTALEILHPFFVGDMVAEPALLNTLLIGAGSEMQSEAYRRWSANTELLELLSATLPAVDAPDQLLRDDRMTSLVDLDLGPVLRVALPSVPASAEAILASPNPTDAAVTSGTPMDALIRYADEYERIRQRELFTPQRTAKLDRLFDDMSCVQGLTNANALELFESSRDGRRIAAIASCLAEAYASTGGILQRALENPRSLFETYHALRVTKLVWSKLPLASQQALAIVVSARFLIRAGENDAPIWSMTLDILHAASDLDPGPNITIKMDGGEVLHLTMSGSFGSLTDDVYRAITAEVMPFHYGTDWRLFAGEVPLIHAREHEGGPGPGDPHIDRRSLADVGVKAGSRLEVRILHDHRSLATKK